MQISRNSSLLNYRSNRCEELVSKVECSPLINQLRGTLTIGINPRALVFTLIREGCEPYNYYIDLMILKQIKVDQDRRRLHMFYRDICLRMAELYM